MTKKKVVKGRYNFLVEKSTYEEFSKICEEEGLIRSKMLENHMKKFIEKNN